MTATTTLYGVTPAGFVAQPIQSILADLQAAWLADVDPVADFSSTTPEGQWLGILANRYAAIWALAEASWNAYQRDEVEGAGLDNLGDLIGIPREGPSFTQVTATLTLDPSLAPYPAGTLIANVVGTPALTFSNLGDVVAIDIVAGVASVTMQATTDGPTGTINPGTLIEITTPVNGWTAITNPLRQTQLGTNVELDPDYQLRQVEEIASDGAATSPSTIAALYVLFATYYGGQGEVGPYTRSITKTRAPARSRSADR
jgi:hypothetical protein